MPPESVPPVASAGFAANAVTLRPDAPFFIVQNAGSGRSSAQTLQTVISEILTAAGRQFSFSVVEDPRDLKAKAEAALRDARESGGVVVAAGGDGTLNAVASVILGQGVPFAILPQGTFNYFGRTYGVSQDTATATRVLLDAVIQPVQVGMLNGRLFLVNASLGLYPTLLEDREAYKKRYGRSRLVAMWSAIVTLFRAHRQLRLRVDGDGERTPHTIDTPTLVVGNNALQLEQIGIEERSALARGRLVGMGAKPVGTLALYKLVLMGLFSRLGEAENVFSFDFERLTVDPRGAKRVKVAMDGEITHLQAPLVFEVSRERLLLLVPRDENLKERG
ncbi:MAG: NAD(+)/NADH kinase [Burkholderiaceae bacterium]|nr:NAD(+)/NADH kinase [Burkholderiaceae bacterium]